MTPRQSLPRVVSSTKPLSPALKANSPRGTKVNGVVFHAPLVHGQLFVTPEWRSHGHGTLVRLGVVAGGAETDHGNTRKWAATRLEDGRGRHLLH